MLPLLRKTSITRAFNFLKLLLSYSLSDVLKKPIHWGMPLALSIEPTTACNLQCPQCPSGLQTFSRKTGSISLDFYRKTIDELHTHLQYLNLYFQGEPFLHPELPEMIAYATQRNIFTVVSTNGHYLTPEVIRKIFDAKLDKLIISMDGITQVAYTAYRKGGSFGTVKHNIKELVTLKKKLKSKTPEVILQFLITKDNQHQVPQVKQFSKTLGIDKVDFKTAQVYQYRKGNPIIPTIEKYSRYRQEADGSFSIKNKLKNKCWRMWSSAIVSWNGTVVPCCFDKDAEHSMGKLSEKSFAEIWKGGIYRKFRRQILHSRASIEICRNCTEGMKVKFK